MKNSSSGPLNVGKHMSANRAMLVLQRSEVRDKMYTEQAHERAVDSLKQYNTNAREGLTTKHPTRQNKSISQRSPMFQAKYSNAASSIVTKDHGIETTAG